MSNTKTVMSQAANTLTTPLNVEDVFSTYLFETNNQTITNGIDLSTEGGLVWLKGRHTVNHLLFDTERGVSGGFLSSSTTASQSGSTYFVDAFNTNGFDTSGFTGTNDYASWTFRKAPKFFDVVTYTGDGVAGRAIPHNLGCEIGTIIVKKTTGVERWWVYHRELGSGKYLALNETTAEATNSSVWGTQTDTDFVVNASTNNVSENYVAYLFAHNDGDGEFGGEADADIIKCGSYTGNGSTDGPEIDLGFEPQFIITKRTDGTGNWLMFDAMRGIATGGNDAILSPNRSWDETVTVGDYIDLQSTGFKLTNVSSTVNESGASYIYMAIRRGTKVPESGTEVFDVVSYTADNTDNRVIATNNRVDTVLARNRNNASERGFNVGDRLRGLDFLGTAVTYGDGGDTDSFMGFDHMKGFEVGNDGTRRLNYSNYTQIAYSWKRAPGFFDVVAYTGNGTAGRTVSHNLGVAPEMMWVKKRSGTSSGWLTYDSFNGATKYTRISATSAASTSSAFWNDTEPTSSVFSLGTNAGVNGSGETYIAYLFASLAGVSKVGSFTGNGTSQTIDCGFTNGARFVLIKRPNDLDNWYLFDTARGITAGNDPILMLNATDPEDAFGGADILDPHSSGFTINYEGSVLGLNSSGVEHIFYAIA